jgi:hypothetical protein
MIKEDEDLMRRQQRIKKGWAGLISVKVRVRGV